MACVVDKAPGAEGAIGGAAGAEVIAGAGAPGRAARGRVFEHGSKNFVSCVRIQRHRKVEETPGSGVLRVDSSNGWKSPSRGLHRERSTKIRWQGDNHGDNYSNNLSLPFYNANYLISWNLLSLMHTLHVYNLCTLHSTLYSNTPPQLKLPKLRLFLNISKFCTVNGLVKPSAI